MKRQIVAGLAAAALSLTGATVTHSSAQEMTMADLYEPSVGGLPAYNVEPSDTLFFLTTGGGNGQTNTQIVDYKSDYPISIRAISGFSSGAYGYISVEPKKIYPSSFPVQLKVKVFYEDGSSEIISGTLKVSPLESLVATSTPEPTTSEPTTAPATSKAAEPTTSTPVTTPKSSEPTTSTPVTSKPSESAKADTNSGSTSDGSSTAGIIVGVIAGILAILVAAFPTIKNLVPGLQLPF